MKAVAVFLLVLRTLGATKIYETTPMNYFRYAMAAVFAILAALGTYASLAAEGFGVLAVIPAIFMAMVVAVPLAPRLS